ncbi:hypothetical protein D3C86_1780150 [compost metagenome]
MSVCPRSARVANTSPPAALMRPRPSMKVAIASAGSSLNAFWNSDEDMPATSAKRSSSSPPADTDIAMSVMIREIAEPPASASMPTDASAFANPRTCASVRPTTRPAPAMRCAICTMSRSVDAPSLPSATSAAPRLST